MNEENNAAVIAPAKAKKKHSFWFLKLILILIIFAGGVVLGLKLNTMPGPNAILQRYFPTFQAQPEAEPAVAAPEMTQAPDVTPAPEKTPAAVETEEPAPLPEATEAPAPAETPAPAEPVAEAKSSAPIGIDAALKAAMDRAKVEEADAVVYSVYPTEQNGLTVYQVDFASGETEYMYLVDMYTAEILGWKTVRVEQSYQGTVPTDVFDTMVPDDMAERDGLISSEDAEQTALSHAGVRRANAVGLECTLMREGSKIWYEVNFTSAAYKYAYEINATDGTVLDFEKTK